MRSSTLPVDEEIVWTLWKHKEDSRNDYPTLIREVTKSAISVFQGERRPSYC